MPLASGSWTIRSLSRFLTQSQALDMLLFVHPLEGGVDADDPIAGVLGNVLQFPFRTTLMIERMILKGMFEKYPNLRLCLSHGGGLLALNIWRLDHSYNLRPDFRNYSPEAVGLLEKTLLRFHRSLRCGITILDPGRRHRPGSSGNGLSNGDGRF